MESFLACSLFGNLLSVNKNCKISSCQYSAVHIDYSEIEGGICCNYERGSFIGDRSQVCRDMVPVGCYSSAEGRKVAGFGPECGTRGGFEHVLWAWKGLKS